MRKFIAPALTALLLASSSAFTLAQAAQVAGDHRSNGAQAERTATESATGTVRSLDLEDRLLTLGNGDGFRLADGVSTHGIRKGESVRLTYAMEGATRMVSKVVILK